MTHSTPAGVEQNHNKMGSITLTPMEFNRVSVLGKIFY